MERLAGHPAVWEGDDEMPDDVFLYAVGILVILAEQVFALVGWACPGLVDKT